MKPEKEKSKGLKGSTRMIIATFSALLLLLSGTTMAIAEILATESITIIIVYVIVVAVVSVAGVIVVMGTGLVILIEQKEESTKEEVQKKAKEEAEKILRADFILATLQDQQLQDE